MSSNLSENATTGTEGVIERCYMTYTVVSPTTAYTINSVIGCIVNCILAILGTFLNGLVVCVFWKSEKFRSKVSYFMLMMLSSIDLCVTIIVHTLFLVNSIAEISEKSRCLYKISYQTAGVLLSGMSFATFFLMNVERYLSIVFPFFHLNKVTKRRCLTVSILVWLACIATAIAPLFHLNIQIFVTTLALIVIIGTIFVYVSIYRVARGRRNIAQRERAASNGQLSALSESQVVGARENRSESYPRDPSKTLSFMHDLQLAKMYLLVVFSTLFLNLPNAVTLVVFGSPIKSLNIAVHMKVWTATLVTMNSTVNTIIFFWSNRRLRKEGVKICKKLLKH